MPQNPLIGTWILDQIQFEDASDGARYDMYGPRPSGYIVITPEGLAMTFIANSDRKAPQATEDLSDLFRTMMCYAGRYRVEAGNKFVTTIDAAWHPSWIGTEQVRFYEIKGSTLSITTALQTHPNFPGKQGRGIVMWHKAAAESH